MTPNKVYGTNTHILRPQTAVGNNEKQFSTNVKKEFCEDHAIIISPQQLVFSPEIMQQPKLTPPPKIQF